MGIIGHVRRFYGCRLLHLSQSVISLRHKPAAERQGISGMKARAQLRVIEGGRPPAGSAPAELVVIDQTHGFRITLRRRKPVARGALLAPLALTMVAGCLAAPLMALSRAF